MADFQEEVKELGNTSDYTSEIPYEDIQKNKVMAVLAYFGILVLIPIFAAKESKFARFHANQGLILFIVSLILYVLAAIFGNIRILGIIVDIICGILGLIALVLCIIGIINAVTGKAKDLPLIGKIRILG